MKICLYPYTEGSGIGTYIIEAANALRRYTPEKILVIGEAKELAEKNGLFFYPTPRHHSFSRLRQLPPISYIQPFFFGKRMSALVHSIKPDIFHTADHLPYHAITAPVVGVGWDFPKGLFGAWKLARMYSSLFLLPYRFLREMEMSIKDYAAMQKVNIILGVTHHVTDKLQKKGYPALYFPPGITMPRGKNVKKSEHLMLTFIARHHIGVKRKGLWHFLDALLLVKKRNPGLSFSLTLIGEIPQGFSLEKYALLKPHIHLLGLLSREKTMERIAQSHLLVAPSLYDEFGYVVLEAQALGTPALVSSHNHAFQELVMNKDLAVDIFDRHVFAMKLLGLLKDKEKLIKLGNEAQQFVAQQYAWEKKVPELMKVYEKVIHSR